jgi:hypothetical protein
MPLHVFACAGRKQPKDRTALEGYPQVHGRFYYWGGRRLKEKERNDFSWVKSVLQQQDPRSPIFLLERLGWVARLYVWAFRRPSRPRGEISTDRKREKERLHTGLACVS